MMNHNKKVAKQITKILRQHGFTVEQLSIGYPSGTFAEREKKRQRKVAAINDIRFQMPHLSLDNLSVYVNINPSVISRLVNS